MSAETEIWCQNGLPDTRFNNMFLDELFNLSGLLSWLKSVQLSFK